MPHAAAMTPMEELTAGLRDIQEVRYSFVAVFCLLVYEWVHGFKDEHELICRARWNSVKVAYMLCRYYPLTVWILLTWAYLGNHDWETCRKVLHPFIALCTPFQIFPQGVMLMRAYAFSGRDKRVLCILCTCFAGLVAVNFWCFFAPAPLVPKILYVVAHGTGCFPDYGSGFSRLGYVMIAAVTMDFLSLAVVLGETWKKRHLELQLGRYFVHQGLLSFGILLFINLLSGLLFYQPDQFRSGVGIPLIQGAANIIACRVVLQLRAQVRPPTDSELSRRNSRVIREAFARQIRTKFLNIDDWTIHTDHLP